MSPSDITVRRSGERGRANHGWLNSYHTFSFASYYDNDFVNFHSLRVINEDRVAPGKGFPEHGHSNAEIFSYVVRGALAHDDSMGNHEELGRGSVQFTSAGSGIHHAEFNASKQKMVHFLQIWVTPSTTGLKPNYQTRQWDDKDKTNKLALIVAPAGTDSKEHGAHVVINQDIKMYASILQPGQTVTYTLPAGRVGYVHVVQDATGMASEAGKTQVTLNDVQVLGSGDGSYLTPNQPSLPVTLSFTCTGTTAEFVLFDIKPSKPLKARK